MTQKPILVTGLNRSGTTWVGKILASSKEVFYVEEPFNYQLRRRNVIPCPFEAHYHSVTEEEAALVRKYLSYRMGQFYPWWLDFKSCSTSQNLLKASARWLLTQYRLIKKIRPLIKDPIAILSAEWLYKEFDLDVIILIRNPLAYVSSIKRLQWPMGPHMFLRQPALMNDYLSPLAVEIEAQSKKENDLMGDAILAWKVFSHVISIYQTQYPNWLVLRHEDLSLDPFNQFQAIFDKLSLLFSERQRQIIDEFCNASNPAEANNQIHQLKRNSKANIENWKNRLTASEINRVREQTYDIAQNFYTNKELKI